MNAFILDGARSVDEAAAHVALVAADVLQNRGWEVGWYRVRDETTGPCVVCGSCGERTPGRCARKDDAHALVEGIARADLAVFVSGISFGGYAAAAKCAIERTMPNVHPLFVRHEGELHHRMRYGRMPALLVAGCEAEENAGREAIFRKTAERNAVNYQARRFAVRVFSGRPTLGETAIALAAALDEIDRGPFATTPPLPFPASDPMGEAEFAGCPLLIVSASGRKRSNSRSIAEYAAARMRSRGATCDPLDLAAAKSPVEDLLAEARRARRILLVSPLYHDGLSYAATCALEGLFDERARLPAAMGLSAVVHSGYPEPVHARTALSAAREFAREVGWRWMGGLTAGGTSPIAGKPLEEAGPLARNLRKGLDIAAEAWARGGPVPDEAVRAAEKPAIPPVFFKWAANSMTRRRLRRTGIDIDARPYAREAGRGR